MRDPIKQMLKNEIEIVTQMALEAQHEGYEDIARENWRRVKALKNVLKGKRP